MAGYKTFTFVGDSGPWIKKLILDLPQLLHANDVSESSFNVYVERKDPKTGELVFARDHHWEKTAKPSHGYIPIRHAYVSDESGNAAPVGKHVVLEFEETRLTKRIDGDITHGHLRKNEFRVTQLRAFPAERAGDPDLVGLAWTQDEGDICPQLKGWNWELSGIFAGIKMNYAAYCPNLQEVNECRMHMPFSKGPLPKLEKIPLVLWLHGAGEGGGEPYRTITGNKVVALGEKDIQTKLGGAAYVLAPSSPTFWMDSGNGVIDDDNQSIYGSALMELVKQFVSAHKDSIDEKRIYVGGLSNGGFMTCRLIADNPGFFAAGIVCCAPWNDDLASDMETKNLAGTPIWFVHADDDPLVLADKTALPTYYRLLKEGAKDVHITYYDHVQDRTGVYHDEDGRPTKYLGHCIWINVYNDETKTDIDGRYVLVDGRPVTLWQWVGLHRLS